MSEIIVSKSKRIISYKFFLLLIIVVLVLAAALSLYTYYYNYDNYLVRNSINPFIVENFTYLSQKTPVLNLLNCKIVCDYSYDDPPLLILEFSCNDSSLNVLRISEPSKQGIVLLVIQIIEYKPKVSNNLIKHNSIEERMHPRCNWI